MQPLSRRELFYWLAAETGLRAGELFGLRAHDVNLEKSAVTVHQAVWNRQVQTPKTDNANREFARSPDLVEHLRDFLATASEPARLTLHLSVWSSARQEQFRVQRLWPLLDLLGISRCGLHPFRHTNGSLMDRIGAPMKLRQQRLGHAPGSDITMAVYTHLIGDDDQKVAAQLGEILRPAVPKFDLVKMQTHGTQ